LFPIITFKHATIALKYGNTDSSPYTFAAIATIFRVMEKYDDALKNVKLAIKLGEKLKISSYYAKFNFLINLNVYPWKYHIHSFYKNYLDIYQKARENGDIEFAAYSLSSYGYFESTIGVNLVKLHKEAIRILDVLKKYKQQVSVLRQRFNIQFFEKLTTQTNTSALLTGSYFNEEAEIPALLKTNDLSTLSYLYVNKTILYYLFGDYENAFQTARTTCEFTSGIRANYLIAIHNFYYSLSILAVFETKNKMEQKKLLKIVGKNQKQMKIWTKHCPANFQHKYDLVEAERLRVLNNPVLARPLYEKAILGAQKYRFLNEEAISWEVAAGFYQILNNETFTKIYIQNAYKKYKIWGAAAKFKQLEKKYPYFIFEKQSLTSTFDSTSISIISSASTTGSSSLLDLTSIVKASQSLSGEVRLEKLLKSMLMLIMENAGSEYAVIIKNDDGVYTIEAKGRHGSENIEVLQSEDLKKSEAVPLNVVKYVIRTRKLHVIDDAIEDKNYSDNKYIQQHKVKSIFCYPVIHKNKLVAVLYLENNLSSHVFTPSRVETINILSSQIAVSIENALLYENLEAKVKKRTEELSEANDKLQNIFKHVSVQKEQLEISHKHITDSINYAKRIQEAILPASELFKRYFSEYFILFKPRDVVSGDFYWAKEVNENLIIAAADCTGHGVPGAFVSMLGISFLNELVGRKEISKANQVLEELRKEIKNSLHQSGATDESKDGMDIALCVINTKTNLMQFSGAYNSVYLYRNNELKEFKADRQPIGIYRKESPFTNHVYQLEKNDVLYSFSDGYVDQFGGTKGRKFLSKRFRKLLLNIQSKDMQEQKQILEQTFMNWKGEKEQVDDVLVVGVKI
jgi:serine phosphatase RsbU (regulator of sigma subunit)